MMTMPNAKLLSLAQVCGLANITERTLRFRILKGEMPGPINPDSGTDKRWFSAAEVKQYLAGKWKPKGKGTKAGGRK
jgi:hypothetical protein